jgi:hypothetical protein
MIYFFSGQFANTGVGKLKIYTNTHPKTLREKPFVAEKISTA